MRSNRVRHLLLAMVAVFALGAVAAASASAHEFIVPCHKVLAMNVPESQWENAECTKKLVGGGFDTRLLESEIEPAENTSGPSTLEGVGLVAIKCEKDVSKDTLESRGDTTGNVKFTECKVVGAATCKVKEPIEFTFNDELTVFKGEPGEIFEPVEGKLFVAITITGCSVEGKYEVTGKQQCELPEATVAKAEHEVVCTPAGSELKLKTAEAKFTSTEKVKLTSGKNWSAKF